MPSEKHGNINGESLRGFLLHLFHRQQRNRFLICGVGKLENGDTFAYTDDRHQPVFYIRVSDAENATETLPAQNWTIRTSHYNTMDGEGVKQVQSKDMSHHRTALKRLESAHIRTYEGDLNPSLYYLINQEFHGSLKISGAWKPGDGIDRVYTNPALGSQDWEPDLAVLSIDIETSEEADRIYAIAMVSRGGHLARVQDEIHLVGDTRPDDPPCVSCYPDEPSMLLGILNRIGDLDPDIITGWNVIDFDLTVLSKRFEAHNIPFNLGRTKDRSWYQEGNIWGGSRMVIYGRQVLDALHLTRSTMVRYEDYRLDTVARAILGRGKTMHNETEESMAERILRAYEEDRRAFCEYCLEDARLVQDILEKEGLIRLTVRRSLLTGLPLERSWGSIAAFDAMYIRAMHERKMVAPSHGIDRTPGHGSPGGLILRPQAGLYRNVLVFDFQSLYPSIIRTFNIDPLAHIKGLLKKNAGITSDSDLIISPNDAVFDRQTGILPEILERFFNSRARAKQEGDSLASFSYKIIMNSCYGVLATGACRFADPNLVTAITSLGHHLLRWVQALLEDEGYHVIYGDTDSLFVDPKFPNNVRYAEAMEKGKTICEFANRKLTSHITETYGVTSRLELEFEKYYVRFLLPSNRGTKDRGRAKGYAGLKYEDDAESLEIVGMEAVRRDWTDMAHELQRSLLLYLFRDRSGTEIEELVLSWVRAVRKGELDEKLYYRKSLRKRVSEYTRTMPPHVRAAAHLPNPSGVIHYAITLDGPQPLGYVNAPLDYDHYVTKQIAPLVSTIAEFSDIDVDGAVLGKPRLFRD